MASISQKIAKKIANYDDQESIGSTFRRKRLGPLLSMIESTYEKNGRVEIIDVGGTGYYWGILPTKYLEDHAVKITIVNQEEEAGSVPDGPFSLVEGDGCDLSQFDDRSFDIAHSNSVIEHVGDWSRMVEFAKEISRVSAQYFVQTPNYWFPIEPHCMTPFFHWLPKPARVSLVQSFQLGHWHKAYDTDNAVRMVEGSRLLNRKMFKCLFPDGQIVTERYLGFAKSFLAIRELKEIR